MKSLEEEVKEYIDNNVFCDGITPFEIEIADKAFIAGANSKWVQAKLKECWDAAHQAGRFEGKGIAEENWQTFEDWYNENII
jgi:hypothetical protein